MKKFQAGIIIILLFSASCNVSGSGLTDNDFPLAQAWSYAAGDMLLSYAVGEDWMVIATPEGLSALDTATGSLLWENDFVVRSGPASIAISDDQLVALGFEKAVKVFSISGDELSTFYLTDNQGVGLAQIAAWSGQYISLIRTSSWVLQIYDLNTGMLLWETYTSRGGPDAYIDTNLNRVFVVNSTKIRSYEIDSGNLMWELTGRFSSASTYHSPTLFFGERNDNSQRVTAYDVSTQVETWSTSIAADVKQLSLHQELILASTPTGIFAFDAVLGDLLWQFSPDDDFSTPVFGIDDQFFARGAISRTIYALSNDGTLVGTLQVGSRVSFVQSHQSYTAGLFTIENMLIFAVENEIYSCEK